MPATQYSSCSSTSWQLTIDYWSNIWCWPWPLPSSDDNSDGKSDFYWKILTMEMLKWESPGGWEDCLVKRRIKIGRNPIVLAVGDSLPRERSVSNYWLIVNLKYFCWILMIKLMKALCFLLCLQVCNMVKINILVKLRYKNILELVYMH